jgi:TonB-dependent SusC/RagA subfamily outer membrane receptor
MNPMKIKVLFTILLSLTLSVSILSAQKKSKKITVSGFVIDADYKPVVGAMILVDNRNTQVYTDNNGYYKVRIRPDAIVISVYTKDKEVRSELIGNQTAINFPMGRTNAPADINEDEGKIDESVDIGYRRINTKRSALPVSKSDVLDVSQDENARYHNIYEMIQSKVPGVDVNGQKIRIRGINTFFENNDPLFVVDGIPVNSINHIMPNTVSSITMLKGSAAAIYGSRGVNGVIVITLKKSVSGTK